jgi:hypothetical protein
MSVDSSHPAARFLADMFADSTSAPVYICSLPNHDEAHSPVGERHVATRELQLVEQFVRKVGPTSAGALLLRQHGETGAEQT